MEQIRRRWLFSLVAFAMGSAVAAGLNLRSELAGTGLAQGAGLGFLGALPLFSVGTLLGAMGRPDDLGWAPGIPVGPGAVLGAAVGFLLGGVAFIPHLAPHTLYLFCLVILSGGALLQGWVLDARVAMEVLARAPGRNGELRVERRVLGAPHRELTVLLEGGRIRGAEDQSGEPGRGWETAVLEILAPDRIQPEAVLCLGGGTGTLGRLLSQRFPHAVVQLVEMDQGVVDLARGHFQDWDGWDSIAIAPGGVTTWQTENPVPVVILDGAVLPALGGVPSLREQEWRLMAERVDSGGLLVMGGLGGSETGSQQAGSGALADLVAQAGRWFQGVALYRRPSQENRVQLLRERASDPEFLLVLSTSGAPPLPPVLSGFRLVQGEGD